MSRRAARWGELGVLMVLAPLFATQGAYADLFIADVAGAVSVKLDGYARAMPLQAGTWLRPDFTLEFQADSRASVLCLGSGEMLTLDSRSSKLEECDPLPQRVMRASGSSDGPVVLIPNQRAVDQVTRIVWAGAKDDRYALTIVKYDAFGTRTHIDAPEWRELDSDYRDTGLHEYELAMPWTPQWNKAQYYEVIVVNLESGRSSNEDDDFTSQIVSKVPDGLVKGIEDSVRRVLRTSDPGLVRLATAAELISRGFRTEAYDRLQAAGGGRWEVATRLAMVRALRIPASPPEVMVREYAGVMSLAANADDVLGATIACHEMQQYLDIVPSAKDQFAELLASGAFVRYCTRPQ